MNRAGLKFAREVDGAAWAGRIQKVKDRPRPHSVGPFLGCLWAVERRWSHKSCDAEPGCSLSKTPTFPLPTTFLGAQPFFSSKDRGPKSSEHPESPSSAPARRR